MYCVSSLLLLGRIPCDPPSSRLQLLLRLLLLPVGRTPPTTPFVARPVLILGFFSLTAVAAATSAAAAVCSLPCRRLDKRHNQKHVPLCCHCLALTTAAAARQQTTHPTDQPLQVQTDARTGTQTNRPTREPREQASPESKSSLS